MLRSKNCIMYQPPQPDDCGRQHNWSVSGGICGRFRRRAASVGLISVAGLRVAEAAFLRSQLFAETGSLTDLFNIKAFIFGVVLYVVYKKTGKHPIIYILASGVIGVILSL